MKRLGKYPTRSELKEAGMTRREHELMYQWFENGCRDYRNISDEETPEGDESDVHVEETAFNTSTEGGGGIGLTNVQ